MQYKKNRKITKFYIKHLQYKKNRITKCYIIKHLQRNNAMPSAVTTFFLSFQTLIHSYAKYNWMISFCFISPWGLHDHIDIPQFLSWAQCHDPWEIPLNVTLKNQPWQLISKLKETTHSWQHTYIKKTNNKK